MVLQTEFSMSVLELYKAITAVLVVLLAIIGSRVLYLLIFHPLAKFPGPKLAAVSNIWYTVAVMRGQQHRRISQCHKRFGPVVRIGPNELSFNTVEAYHDIYGCQGSRRFLKGPSYDGFVNEGEPSLVAVKDPVIHGKKRKFLAHAFSAQALQTHEPIVQSFCDLFIKQLDALGTAEGGVDLTRWYNWFTFDLIGDLAFGESFECLKTASEDPWVSVVLDHSSSIIWLDILRRFPLFAPLVRKLLVRKEILAARRQHYLFSQQRVQKRMKMGTDRKDFMSYILDQPDEHGLLSEAFLTLSASTFVVAGSETTGTALAGLTYWLVKTPAAMDKLNSEVRSHFKSYEEINSQALQDLPYLAACIQEGFRMFPPSPNGAGRVCPGATIHDRYVAAGVEVSANPISMTRNPEYFKNPDSFVPERWLEKKDRLEASEPFSIGSRACIGRNLAYMEIRLLIAKIVYTFDLTMANKNLDWDAETWPETFWHKPPLIMRFERRR